LLQQMSKAAAFRGKSVVLQVYSGQQVWEDMQCITDNTLS
jgi:hypothetical protein